MMLTVQCTKLFNPPRAIWNV